MALNRKVDCGLPPLREKVDQYSYANKESIGKGFSSSVYRGKDDRTGMPNGTQTSKWRSR